MAHGLHALGVNPGDRVGFLGLNHPRFFFTLFAAAKLDAIFVPLNFRLTGPELTFIIRDAGLHTLVYEEAFASIVDSIRGDLSVREYVCAVEQSGSRGFDSLLHDQRDTDLDYQVAMSDVALIMYTSGTTGRPKGAMLTHGNIIWNNINVVARGRRDVAGDLPRGRAALPHRRPQRDAALRRSSKARPW